MECALGALEDGEVEGASSEEDADVLDALQSMLSDYKALLESFLAEAQKVGNGLAFTGSSCWVGS
jgi:hypothetical protein